MYPHGLHTYLLHGIFFLSEYTAKNFLREDYTAIFFFEGKDYTATWLTMAGPLPKVSIGPKFGDRPVCENIVGWPLTLTWPPSSQQLYALSCLLSLGLTVVSGSLRSISRPFFSKFLSFCDKKGLEKNSENIFGEIEKISRGILEREKKFKKKFR